MCSQIDGLDAGRLNVGNAASCRSRWAANSPCRPEASVAQARIKRPPFDEQSVRLDSGLNLRSR